MSEVNAKLNIVLHPCQREIEKSPARFKVIRAGKRFGKTKWAIYSLLRKAGKPRQVLWYTAPTYRQAKSIAWSTIMWMLPREVIKRKSETDLMIELHNGTRIELKGEDNEDSLRGIEIDGIVRDECAYSPEETWGGILRGQLRPVTGFAYFVSSPNKKGRNWFSNFCDVARQRQADADKEWAYFYYTIYDNPTIPRDEIEKIKAENPQYVWDLEYMAIDSVLAGQLYSEFSYDNNIGVCGNDKLPLYRGIDWGMDHPTVCLWARLDKAKRMVYVVDEYVKSGNLINENVSAIKGKTGDAPVEWSVIDPSAARKDPATGRSVRDEFARWGLHCIEGDRRERGVDVVKMFLKNGLLKIDPKCKELIYELKNLQWGDKTGDDVTDALRYLLVRIHDIVFAGNTFGGLEQKQEPVDPRVMNIYDPLLFPKPKHENSWIMDEVMAY